LNDAGNVAALYCGHWISSHRAACDAFAAANSVNVEERRRLVVASCGGHPLDINMIQAHKAIEAASAACAEGGTIILLAECPDGLGRHDFLKWFNAGSSDALAETLCSGYQVNGQTAWSLLRNAERFDIRIVTSIDARSVGRMRMTKIAMDEAVKAIDTASPSGYIMPAGAKIRVTAN
jgi:nickel-dependent lactate racemase